MAEKTDAMEDIEEDEQHPLLVISELRFKLGHTAGDKKAVQQEILELIQKHEMGPFYNYLCSHDDHRHQWSKDAALAKKLEDANAKKLKELEEAITNAVEKEGETEEFDAHLAKANHFANIGDKAAALEAYATVLEKAVGPNAKLNISFAKLRVAFFWSDLPLLKELIAEANLFAEKGGDWEQKNKLKVYEGTYLLLSRDFRQASDQFISTIATFGAPEIYSFNRFVFYTVVSSVASQPRPALRKSVVDKPEVLSVIDEIPHLRSFLYSLYNCKYREFFTAFSGIIEQVTHDPYFASHADFLIREIRVVVYSQFLDSYRSVTLASMAESFGVSTDFIDSDLSRFIAAGRLNCKIDKVGGVVETTRPDARNAQYLAVIKQGDLLLNRVQKLSRIVAL